MRAINRHAFRVLPSALQSASQTSSYTPIDLLASSELGLADEISIEATGIARRSEAALYGSNRLGNVQLPSELQSLVSDLTQGLRAGVYRNFSSHCSCKDCDRDRLRYNALSLYDHLRASGIDPRQASDKRKAQRDPRPKKTLPPYNSEVTLAYAAGLMSSVYAATLRVFHEIDRRLLHPLPGESAGWTPTHIVDWGSGTGSAAW